MGANMTGRPDRLSQRPGRLGGGMGDCKAAVPGGDPLSDVLETVRLRGALFFLWEPSWPYATCVPRGERFGALILPGAEQIVSYHIVVEGPCWGLVEGEAPLPLESGDILLLPHGDAYAISDRPQLPATESAAVGDAEGIEFFRLMAAGELPPVVVDGGGGPQRNRIICGFLGCERQPRNSLLGSLPRLLRVPAPRGDDPLAPLIDFALAASRQSEGGERCLLMRLSETLFVEVLRRYLRTAPAGEGGWLQALRDPLVGRALALMHRRPAEGWTLARLAAEVGASRSTLAEHFSGLLGEPPMQYLASWRMQLAARRLADGRSKVAAVAREVGYESEAAFSRAFKRATGVTARDWRAGRRADD